jgi:hypothetical protein
MLIRYLEGHMCASEAKSHVRTDTDSCCRRACELHSERSPDHTASARVSKCPSTLSTSNWPVDASPIDGYRMSISAESDVLAPFRCGRAPRGGLAAVTISRCTLRSGRVTTFARSARQMRPLL